MMQVQKHNILLFVFFLVFIAVDSVSIAQSYQELLNGYIRKDREIKRLNIGVQNASLALRRFTITTGTEVSVSTGSIQTQFNSGGVSVSAQPSVSVAVPGLNNVSFNAGVPFKAGSRGNGMGAQLGLQSDIISGTAALQKVNLFIQERSFLIAKRNLDARRSAAEREFLAKLKTLYSYEINMLNAKVSLAEAIRDFETVRVQGYGSETTRFRSAQLKVRSRDRTVEEFKRVLERELAAFAVLCGYTDITLPEDIPNAELLSIKCFPRENFLEFENAFWVHCINSMQRKASAPGFVLKGSAGYSYSGNVYSFVDTLPAVSDEHVVNGDLSAEFQGLSVSAGISVPVSGDRGPAATVSLGWKMNTRRLNRITKELGELASSLELLDIDKAEDDYATSVIEFEKKYEDLLWQKQEYTEELDLYKKQSEDSARFFERGIIPVSDYEQARSDYELSRVQNITACIERLIYNLDLRALFLEETN